MFFNIPAAISFFLPYSARMSESTCAAGFVFTSSLRKFVPQGVNGLSYRHAELVSASLRFNEAMKQVYDVVLL